MVFSRISHAIGLWFAEILLAATPLLKIGGAVVGLGFCVSVAFSLYSELDKAGWISRDHDTPTWIEGDWMVGEYRDCDLLTTTPVVVGSNYSKDELLHLPRLYCGRTEGGFFKYAGEFQGTNVSWKAVGKSFHTFSVKYWGRLERPTRWKDAWRCKRLGESIECKALN